LLWCHASTQGHTILFGISVSLSLISLNWPSQKPRTDDGNSAIISIPWVPRRLISNLPPRNPARQIRRPLLSPPAPSRACYPADVFPPSSTLSYCCCTYLYLAEVWVGETDAIYPLCISWHTCTTPLPVVSTRSTWSCATLLVPKNSSLDTFLEAAYACTLVRTKNISLFIRDLGRGAVSSIRFSLFRYYGT